MPYSLAPPATPRRDDTPDLVVRGKRTMRKIENKDAFKLRQWEMDFRFVREVERLEREGHVPSRKILEKTVGLEVGGVAAIRLGTRGVGLVAVAILFDVYRGDRDFIMHGSRNKELSTPYVPGVGYINKYAPTYHLYSTTARWRVGVRPETRTPHPDGSDAPYSAYYPDDMENANWSPPNRKNVTSQDKDARRK